MIDVGYNELLDYATLKQREKSLSIDMGIDDLSEKERNVLSAVILLLKDQKAESITTHQLREHSLCADLNQPSFYRTLRKLTEKGILQRMKDMGEDLRNYDLGLRI